MNHPNDQQLMSWTYDEADAATRLEIGEHLRQCALCRQRVSDWQAVRGTLQQWKVRSPAPAARHFALFGGVKWAAAACVLLGSGFAAARLTSPRVDLAAMRAELSQQLKDQVRQTVAQETNRFTADQAARQAAFQQAMLDAVNQLEIRQVTDHASLRRDVETVALRTQEEFERLGEADRAEPVQPVSR